MQVEVSLAELLINAIAAGRVPGVQFKRGWSDEKATFEALKAVVGNRLDGARKVAVESAMHQFNDERGPSRLRRAEQALETIQKWDVLNPPRTEVLADAKWLRDLVDDALRR